LPPEARKLSNPKKGKKSGKPEGGKELTDVHYQRQNGRHKIQGKEGPPQPKEKRKSPSSLCVKGTNPTIKSQETIQKKSKVGKKKSVEGPKRKTKNSPSRERVLRTREAEDSTVHKTRGETSRAYSETSGSGTRR